METSKKISSFLILFTAAFLFVLAGCQAQQKSAKTDLKSDSDSQQDTAVSKRFQGADSGSQTAVDAAIKLAQEYAELSERMTQLQKKNQELVLENARLKDHIAVLEPKLQQATKELDESNDLLIQMRIELNNWKTDILGFRDEIRQADKAQLQTLLKILEVLGGEIKLSSEQSLDVNSVPESE
ncbi:MAG: hypothetical protein CVV39_00980 [Planctomycetes bacterium HGW-Planctomycetes-1]|nr:MAG: hypothetical protein CVV39_00980 [Planctomycetes bacterium HGW-Planctomycetes-1]